MKNLFLILFLAASTLLTAQNPITLDSTRNTYFIENEVTFEYITSYFSNGRITTELNPLCGGPDYPSCDTIQSKVIDETGNHWKYWAGYKSESQKGKIAGRDLQRDGVTFFNLQGDNFTKEQNIKYFPFLSGRYSITTNNMSGSGWDLVMLPNNNVRFRSVLDTNIVLDAQLTSEFTFIFKEKRHAQGVMIVTGNNQLVGDVITVNGSTFTEGVQFTIGANITATATNLAAVIDALPNVSAYSRGAIVFITADQPGATGNSITMSYTQGTGNGLTISGSTLVGGSNANADETTYFIGLTRTNNTGRPVFEDESGKIKFVKKT